MTRRGILLIGNYPPPYGGIPTHLMYLSEHLAERGWQVHVLPGNIREHGLRRVGDAIYLHRPTRWDRWPLLTQRKYEVAGLARWRHLYPTLRKFLAAQSRLRYLKRVCLEHRIEIICSYHVFEAADTGALLGEDLGIPMITSIFGEIYSHTAMFRARHAEVAFVARQTRRWLSCSHHCARSMELLDLAAKVETLHYGIDTRHFHSDLDGGVIRQRLGIPPQHRLVIFVGRMKHEMGLGILMQSIPLVLRRRPDVHFVVAGARGELTDAVRDMSARLPERVHVAKDVPYDDLPYYYAAANFAVAPSINARACLGLAIAEALATGRPVIGCDVGGTREVLAGEDMGRVIPPHDPFALSESILELAGDEAGCRDMGRRGREHVERNFDKNGTNQRMETIIEEVLSGDRIGRSAPAAESASGARLTPAH